MGVRTDDLIGLLPDFISSRIGDRTKRQAPRRTTLEPIHRIVFYKGHVYEWGTGWVMCENFRYFSGHWFIQGLWGFQTSWGISKYFSRFFRHNGYHLGRQAVTRDCPVTWEAATAGYSSCPAHLARDFINNYRDNFGAYNLVTNNCHHFSNRFEIVFNKVQENLMLCQAKLQWGGSRIFQKHPSVERQRMEPMKEKREG